MAKEFTIVKTYYRISGENRVTETTGNLDYLKEYFGYTLECGRSWQYEKGNQKIPSNNSIKSAKTLVKALNNSESNRSRNGYSNTYYELKEN